MTRDNVTDIEKRLRLEAEKQRRARGDYLYLGDADPWLTEAADTITTLRKQLENAREALRPFAECAEQIEVSESDEEWAKFRLLIKDYRRAREALKGQP